MNVVPSSPSVGIKSGLVPPKKPTFARWRRIAFSRLSLLRTLQYEAIAGVPLSGTVLDVGGDLRSGYHALFGGKAQFETINLEPKALPTHKLDLEEVLPLESGRYAHVISLNTFEHINNDALVISESLRVLATGGTFHFLVPFIYRVHGSPRDFSRHTPEWWDGLLQKNAISDYCIEPLVWDRNTTGLEVTGRAGIFSRAVLMLLSIWDVKGAFGRFKSTAESREEREKQIALLRGTVALGFYVRGTKRGSPPRLNS